MAQNSNAQAADSLATADDEGIVLNEEQAYVQHIIEREENERRRHWGGGHREDINNCSCSQAVAEEEWHSKGSDGCTLQYAGR